MASNTCISTPVAHTASMLRKGVPLHLYNPRRVATGTPARPGWDFIHEPIPLWKRAISKLRSYFK